MLFLFVLLQLAQPIEGKLARQTALFHFAPNEEDLAQRTHGTVFQQGGMPHFPGLMDQYSLIEDMQAQLDGYKFPQQLVREFTRQRIDVSLSRLQTYWVWTQLRQQEAGHQGPEWVGQRRRGMMSASLGSQRFPGAAKLGLDHIIKPGMGKKEHIHQAR